VSTKEIKTELQNRVAYHIDLHRGLRPAARVLNIDPSYLSRLLIGSKSNPSKSTLRKLKLRKVITYEAY
jgi:hypothetical protein